MVPVILEKTLREAGADQFAAGPEYAGRFLGEQRRSVVHAMLVTLVEIGRAGCASNSRVSAATLRLLRASNAVLHPVSNQ